ncbi:MULTISPECIES: aldo/keto reductase [Raoultella]|uniref:aldo/keto reductase n=1 Tax=Raoultella TaxID=160674 RepID=UPI00216734C7|nr:MULTISPECIES: aldo/keto reductase [Raoultella]MCS4273670.1 aryl-alcohol dehydrogenase-like predicted oxidoreductase [Raoultella sp. BIGb0132]MCS4290299.1 aryl-alcohol dehydrogenase-like predicted oxidoreductase [Raoultella terrigena]
MNKIKLGTQGLEVSVIGLGCMSLSGLGGGTAYGDLRNSDGAALIHRYLELGGNFLDTADIYGDLPHENEALVGSAIKGKRDKFVIATKFGWEMDSHNKPTGAINGRPEYIKVAVERSLKSLGTDYIDLYYLHRRDKSVPIEETVGVLGDLVTAGKIRHIGLCEVSSENIIKAHATFPLTAVQSEYSLFERRAESVGVLGTLKSLGIGFVAYSPLGRGFLTGSIKKPEDLPENDFRLHTPRFQGEQFAKNLELVTAIERLAFEKAVVPSQLALAWVRAQGIVPIPGTKRIKYLEQNLAAGNIQLTKSELSNLESIVPLGTETGNSYNDDGMAVGDY